MRVLNGLLLVLLIAAATLGVAWQRATPPPLPASSEAAVRLQPGQWAVGEQRHTLEDPRRATNANGEFPGAPTRTLAVRLWYPAEGDAVAAGAHPLLVWSHGFFGFKDEPDYLARHLASHGYVVIAADFPLTHFRAPGGANVFDVVNQPGDVSFLIDTLLAWNADGSSAFAGRIDAGRIAIAGLSLGGMTTELAAFHPRMRDPRIKAAISVAGPLQFFDRRFFEHAAVPFMMIAGDIDAMVPYEDNARPVLERIDDAWLVSIRGASHTGFADQASMLRLLDNPDSIGCFMVRDRIPERTDDTTLFDLLGSEDEGIMRIMENPLCRMDPLPVAMSPLAQQRIVTLAVQSFLESVLNPDDRVRAENEAFLRTRLAKEFDGVMVERAVP
jgi:predicted dienelactone hydrolase